MHVVIIGNGVGGVSTAFRIRRHQPDWKITLISGESTYHYSRPALMYIFMGHMRYRETKPYEDHVWEEQRIDLVRDWVLGIDPDQKELKLHKGEAMSYDKLVIATGSKSNKFGWPGQDLDGVQGLWDLADLKSLYATSERTKHAVIVGGGLIGIELAEMLHSRGIHVTFLVREKSYWNNILPAEESQMINEVITMNGIDLRLETELDEILDDGQGRVRGITTKSGEEIVCQMVGLTAGVSPNIDMVKESPIATGRGVLCDFQLRTPTPDVWAVGDCAELVTEGDQRNVINQVWYTGKMQGEIAGDNIAGIEREYAPPLWYNSAKFFDLEYQVYGRVNMRVPGERNTFWRHPTEMKSIRIVDHPSEGVIGVQTMGIRYRQRVCEDWISKGRDINDVLERLSDANFDPEFFTRHEDEARSAILEQIS